MIPARDAYYVIPERESHAVPLHAGWGEARASAVQGGRELDALPLWALRE